MASAERAQACFGENGLLVVPGLEASRGIHAGRFAQPPIHYLTGRRLAALRRGAVTMSMPASGWFCGPKGRLHPGIFGFLADMTHFYAVVSTLPAGAGCTTAELSMTVLGEPPPSGAEITAQSTVIYSDERNALTEGLVLGPEGQPAAHSTSRSFVFAPSGAGPPGPGAAAGPDAAAARPAPPGEAGLLAQAPPQVIPADTAGLSGLEILKSQLAGEIPAAPVDRFLGIRLDAADDGRVVFTLPARPDLAQELGTVFGGAIVLLAKSASGAAVQSIAPAGTGFTALDLKVNFLRPARPEGGELVATGSVIHRGSMLSIADTVITQGRRRIAIASGTTALTPP